jgi:hypothetical protein
MASPSSTVEATTTEQPMDYSMASSSITTAASPSTTRMRRPERGWLITMSLGRANHHRARMGERLVEFDCRRQFLNAALDPEYRAIGGRAEAG